MNHAPRTQETLEAEGHLIDSQLLSRIFDKIVERGGAYEVEEFHIGRTNDEPSRARLVVSAPDERVLRDLVAQLVPLGCRMVSERDARLEACTKDGCAPLDFYSTTNHRTQVRLAGRWTEVERQRMDADACVSVRLGICCRSASTRSR